MTTALPKMDPFAEAERVRLALQALTMRVDQLQAEREDLERRIGQQEAYQAKVVALTDQVRDLEEELREARDGEIAREARLKEIEKQLETNRGQLRERDRVIGDLRQQLDEVRRAAVAPKRVLEQDGEELEAARADMLVSRVSELETALAEGDVERNILAAELAQAREHVDQHCQEIQKLEDQLLVAWEERDTLQLAADEVADRMTEAERRAEGLSAELAQTRGQLEAREGAMAALGQALEEKEALIQHLQTLRVGVASGQQAEIAFGQSSLETEGEVLRSTEVVGLTPRPDAHRLQRLEELLRAALNELVALRSSTSQEAHDPEDANTGGAPAAPVLSSAEDADARASPRSGVAVRESGSEWDDGLSGPTGTPEAPGAPEQVAPALSTPPEAHRLDEPHGSAELPPGGDLSEEVALSQDAELPKAPTLSRDKEDVESPLPNGPLEADRRVADWLQGHHYGDDDPADRYFFEEVRRLARRRDAALANDERFLEWWGQIARHSGRHFCPHCLKDVIQKSRSRSLTNIVGVIAYQLRGRAIHHPATFGTTRTPESTAAES